MSSKEGYANLLGYPKDVGLVQDHTQTLTSHFSEVLDVEGF